MTIEERFEIIEKELGRQKRRNRWLLSATMLVAGGLIVPAALETTAFRARAHAGGTPKEIRANKFVLGDEYGKVRAELGVSLDGPGLRMYDAKGNPCAELGVSGVGIHLRLWDEKGNVRAGLGVVENWPGLWLLDDKGTTRAQLTIYENRPALTLFDEKGTGRAALDVFKGNPSVGLWDEKEIMRARLTVFEGNPSLSLLDAKGMARFLAGKIKIEKANAKTIEFPESSLVLFGPDGKIIWSAIK